MMARGERLTNCPYCDVGVYGADGLCDECGRDEDGERPL